MARIRLTGAHPILPVSDLRAALAHYERLGFRVRPPADMPWGMHEGTHTDPDGNVIRYGSPIAEADPAAP